MRQANQFSRENSIGYGFTVAFFTAFGKEFVGHIERLGTILFVQGKS